MNACICGLFIYDEPSDRSMDNGSVTSWPTDRPTIQQTAIMVQGSYTSNYILISYIFNMFALFF